jgi:hypothetical protein
LQQRDEQRAEIERWKLTVALREAEIERLRGLLRDTQRVYHDTQWAQLTEARAEIDRLRELVKDLADDLEAEVNGHYPPEVRAYPSEQRRYERDMANVYAARRELEPKP